MPARLVSRMAILACLSLASAACFGGRPHGVVVDTDGSMLSMTAENMRLVHGHRLAETLQHELGEGWQAQAQINQLPIWDEDHDPKWYYPRASVTLLLRPPDGQSLDHERIGELAREAFGYRVGDGNDPQLLELRVEMTEELQPPPDRPLPAADAEGVETVEPETDDPAAEPAAATPVDAGGWQYRIEAGDTLAAISSAFYGSPQHWRRIAEANPELDPAALTAGTSIRIPAPPDSEPAEQPQAP